MIGRFGWRMWLAFAILAALPALPFMTGYRLNLAFDALLFGIVAMSLDLLMGYTGMISFGHAAFLGLRAYSTAILLERGVRSLWLCLGAAVVVVGVYALVVAYFATTRRGIYFALLTLIFAEVVYTFFRYTQTFGGSDGIQGLEAPHLIPGVPASTLGSPLENYYLVLILLLLTYVLCRTLVESHFGRVLIAIRENEDRARFLGYHVRGYKMAVCLISALLAGVAGAVYPVRLANATPDLLLWTISGEAIVMVMIGGIGTLVGPVIGGVFFILLQEEVSTYAPRLYQLLGFSPEKGAGLHFLIIGIILVLIVLFMPKGLVGLFRRRRARRAPSAAVQTVPAGELE
ncbi:MAG: branched-chain amino acid ABC transporter permease [Candidatus Rokubacteria bacterium]|nr:branched-chain amino acid ABC transporter permease [Candidatus Rokubacteria bacterium]